jgi:hypothetical protein
VAVVIARSGRRIRPATSQPSVTDPAAMRPSITNTSTWSGFGSLETVYAGDASAVEGLPPVQGNVDRHALAAQPGRHRLGQLRMVLGHQDPHALYPRPRLGPQYSRMTDWR